MEVFCEHYNIAIGCPCGSPLVKVVAMVTDDS